MTRPPPPGDLLYNRDHQWLRVEGDLVRSGITHFGQDELGEILVVYLPRAGQQLAAGAKLLEIESAKVIWELPMPVDGEVVEVNPALDGAPDLINRDPYGEGWIAVLRATDPAQLTGLLDAAGYAAFLASVAGRAERPGSSGHDAQSL